MGIEFTVNSLEEMCDLMCDNKIPDRCVNSEYKVVDEKDNRDYVCSIRGRVCDGDRKCKYYSPIERNKVNMREEIVESGYIYHLPKGAKP